jgi:hypothetical protein
MANCRALGAAGNQAFGCGHGRDGLLDEQAFVARDDLRQPGHAGILPRSSRFREPVSCRS